MKNTDAVMSFLKEIKNTANKAKNNKLQYEDNSIKPLTCDRLISRVMVVQAI